MLTLDVSGEGTIIAYSYGYDENVITKGWTPQIYPDNADCFGINDDIFLQAIPAEGYEFDYWTGTDPGVIEQLGSYKNTQGNDFTAHFKKIEDCEICETCEVCEVCEECEECSACNSCCDTCPVCEVCEEPIECPECEVCPDPIECPECVCEDGDDGDICFIGSVF